MTDDRIARAWTVIEEEIDPPTDPEDFYLSTTNERLGDLVSAWALLEQAWRGGARIDDVLQSIDVDSIGLDDDAKRILFLSDLMGMLGDGLMGVVDYVSSPLAAVMLRQSIRSLDPGDYLGDTSEYTKLRLERARARLLRASTEAEYELTAEEAGLLLDLSPGEVAALGAEGINSASVDVIERLLADPTSPDELLRRFLDDAPTDATRLLAVGAFLAMTGRADDAMHYLERADQPQQEYVPDGAQVARRYMYVDCCAVLGVTPKRTFADLVLLPHIQGFGDGLYTMDWEPHHYYPILRAQMVTEGKAHPFSSLSQLERSGSTRGSVVSSRQLRPGSDEVAIQVSRLLEEIRREQAETRTDIGGLKGSLDRIVSREAFLLEQLSNLLPAKRKQTAIDELRSHIREWSSLPQSARDRLLAARYLSFDPQLNASEAVASILVAIGMAVEQLAKSHLKLGPGVTLRSMQQWIAERESAPWVTSLEQLIDVRNVAAHEARGLARKDVAEAWEVVLGTHAESGVLDCLVRYARTLHGD